MNLCFNSHEGVCLQELHIIVQYAIYEKNQINNNKQLLDFCRRYMTFNANKAELFESSFFLGGNLTPSLYFKMMESNINITLYQY